MTIPRPSPLRHRVDPLAIPPVKAARRIGLTLEQFEAKLPELRAAKFPEPNPVTGNYALPAIDRWVDPEGNPQGELTGPTSAPNHGSVTSMGERFRAAQERRRNDRAS